MEMQALQPPTNLQLTGNVVKNWRRFKQRFQLYLSAIGADEKDKKMKASLFLHVVGEEALEVYNNFQFENEVDGMDLEKILTQLVAYCILKTNVTFEKHRFSYMCTENRRRN